MYQNNQLPIAQLPSAKQLIISTLIALTIAIFLLISVVLPAEYAKDITGIGKWLGLQTMGEIKQQLSEEALTDAEPVATSIVKTLTAKTLETEQMAQSSKTQAVVVTPTAKQTVNSVQVVTKAKIAKTARLTVTLKPGDAAEIKLSMQKQARVSYKWSVDNGHVNYDTHADNANTRYFAYHKGKATREDKGVLTAAFNGKHGWFWRNRSKQMLTLTLEVTGDFSDIARVL
jgi:hypothetical protein